MLSRKQMIGLAITRMMMQDKWAEKYDPDNRFGINQYDYNLEKDYLFRFKGNGRILFGIRIRLKNM